VPIAVGHTALPEDRGAFRAPVAGPRVPRAGSVPRTDYCVVFLLVVISGNPVVPRIFFSTEVVVLCVASFLACRMLSLRRLRFSRESAAVFILFSSLLLTQTVLLGTFHWVTMGGFLSRLFIGFAAVQLVPRFPQVFCRVMVLLALIALFFWLFQVSGLVALAEGPIRALPWNRGGGTRQSVLVHTFIRRAGSFSQRNSGMFWEPGAFAGYLNLALLLLTLIRDSFPVGLHKRYRLILFAACLSTMSTGGYMVLPFIFLFHNLGRKRQIITPQCAVAIVVVVVGSYFAWYRLNFVGQKTLVQYESAMVQSKHNWHLGRLGTAVFDWEYIRRRPFTGWGLHSETRWALNPNFEELGLAAMGNGLSDFTAKFGLIGLGCFVAMLWLGFCRLPGASKPVAALATGIILLQLNGECFLNYPLFLGLMFLAGAPGSQPRVIPSQMRSEREGKHEQNHGR